MCLTTLNPIIDLPHQVPAEWHAWPFVVPASRQDALNLHKRPPPRERLRGPTRQHDGRASHVLRVAQPNPAAVFCSGSLHGPICNILAPEGGPKLGQRCPFQDNLFAPRRPSVRGQKVTTHALRPREATWDGRDRCFVELDVEESTKQRGLLPPAHSRIYCEANLEVRLLLEACT